MSTALSALLPVRKQQPERTRHLHAVDRPRKTRRPRLVYALTAVIGAVAIGAAQLGLSIATTQTTYEVRDLTQQQRALTIEGQSLFDEVAGLTSPQYLAANASSLGMIVGGSPSYLRLSDGALIGTPELSNLTTVNPNGNSVVKNALISDTPLVTEPDKTIDGKTAPEKSEIQPPAPALPPALNDGLPTPETH